VSLSALAPGKIPTETPQPSAPTPSRAVGSPGSAGARSGRRARPGAQVRGDTRAATRGDDRVVVEVEGGITVYPARCAGDRWRAVWYEDGRRRQCEAITETRLAARLAKVRERLAADAPNMEQPGADLIAHYLSPGRHPAGKPWSRKHADTQTRLCTRYLTPVIAGLACQDIKTAHMQAAVNAAPTAGEGERVRRAISALVSAGITGGYLASPRLKNVRWQSAGRSEPAPATSIAGETALFVDPGQIPAPADVTRLAHALAYLHPDYQLMACAAAYTGLRWGELAALTAAQIDTDARTITVDRKIIEIGGHLFTESPKGRKHRRTIYPRHTPGGYPLADQIAARTAQAAAQQQAGTNPHGLLFPSPRGRHWRSSNFARRVLAPAYLAAGWRDPDGHGTWTWHSLRHVFCTTALFTWNIEPADVSRLAGHATSAPPSTCTSAPPPAPSTAPAPPPNNTQHG
jgi:integrase